MGRPTTDEGASRAAHRALLNLPNEANSKAKQQHQHQHSVVVRKRIEYSNRYASCLRSWHLLDAQSCQQRTTQNSHFLSCLLFGFKSKVLDGGSEARPRRAAGKLRVRPSKPTSAFYADTFFTCTFLLLISSAIVSLLLLNSAAASLATGALANQRQHQHQHQQHQQHQQHSHNEILHQSVYQPLGRHDLQRHEPSRSKRQPALGRHWRAQSGQDQDQRPPNDDESLKRMPRPRAASHLQRDPLKPQQFQQQHHHHSDHPSDRFEHKREGRARAKVAHPAQPMRFRGFSTPHRPMSLHPSEPNLTLDSDDEFDSYNVDDVFKDADDAADDGDDEDDAQSEHLDDSDEQLEDEEEEEGEEEEEEDEAENEIELDANARKSTHSNQPRTGASNYISTKHAIERQQKYQQEAGRKSQRHPNSVEPHQTGQPNEGARRPAQAGRRHHELPKPRVPYQTPIVVSISDNSFVSASPVVLTTSSSAGEDRDAGSETAASEQRHELAATSTTATTTREAFTGQASSELGLGLEDEVGREPESTRTTSGAPIVLGNLNRYKYIVSDLERPRRPASERQSRKREREQQGKGLKAGASLEMQLPGRRSRTMQTSEPNVDLAPTDSTLSVPLDHADREDDSLHVDDVDSLADDSDDEQDDDDDENEDENDDDDDEHDGEQVDAGQEVELDARFARASQQLDEFVRKSVADGAQPTSGKYSNLIVSPRNELPASYGRRHLASIRMIQGDPNEYQQGGALNGAIIAILSGIGVTGVLVLIVGVKMRSIRERIAHKGRRRSLVPDTDFLINTIPI